MSEESEVFYKLISALDAKLSTFLTEIRRGVGDFMSVEHHYGGRYATVLVRPSALSRAVFDAASQTLAGFLGWQIRIQVLPPSKAHGSLPDFEVVSSAQNPLTFERYLAQQKEKLRQWSEA